MAGLGREKLDDVLNITILPEWEPSTAKSSTLAAAPLWASFWAGKKLRNNVIIFTHY